MERLLASLATDEQIDTCSDCLVDVSLATTGAPTDAADHVAAFDQQRLAPHHFLHAASEIARGRGFSQRADQAHDAWVIRVQRAFDGDIQLSRQLHVIADLRMQVQRQVIGQQADVVAEQRFQPPLLHARDTGVLALPEVTMVYQHQVGASLNGRVKQGLAGGDATDDAHDLWTPFHLKAIGAIILNLGTVQVAVGFFDQGTQRDSHKKDSRKTVQSGTSALIMTAIMSRRRLSGKATAIPGKFACFAAAKVTCIFLHSPWRSMIARFSPLTSGLLPNPGFVQCSRLCVILAGRC
ncbi:hypothetical protein D3C76_1008190 [compost metagenome]